MEVPSAAERSWMSVKAKGCRVAVVPAQAREYAEPIGDLLLGVQRDAVLFAVARLRGLQVQRRVREQGRVIRGVGEVDEAEQVRLARMSRHVVVEFQFGGGVAVALADVRVEVEVVGDLGFHERTDAEGPAGIDPFGDGAVGVAARVGRVVPGAGVHQRPVHELGSRVVRVGVVVEKVGGGDLAEGEDETTFVPGAGDLVLVVVDGVLAAAEADGLAEEVPGRR